MQAEHDDVVMLQIRHVPDDVHVTLKSRAARAGMSLSDYALAELTRVAARPSLEEFRERIAAHGRVELAGGVVVDALERARQERDEELQAVLEQRRGEP